MKLTYTIPLKPSRKTRFIAAVWNYAIPTIFIYTAGYIHNDPIWTLFAGLGAIPLFLRVEV